MSGLLNPTLNDPASNLDSSGRPYTTSFSGQSNTTPGFHHSGALQGLHNIHGSYNLPNMPGSFASRNVTIGAAPLGSFQQPGGSISSGRFASNNILVASTQMTHGPGVSNRGGIDVGNHSFGSSNMNGVGGSISGLSSSSATGNRSSVPGLGVSPALGNVGPRLASTMGNIVGGDNMERNINSGGLSMPGLVSRVNLATNSGSGNFNVQGPNRLISGILQQGGSSDFSVDLHQKEQLHESISTLLSPHLPMTRSTGFSIGGTFPPNRQQQQLHATAASSGGLPFTPGNNQDLRSHGSDFFPSSHGKYHSRIQNSGAPRIGMRQLNSPASGMSAYDQLMQQYQQPQGQSQFRLQQIPDVSQSYRDQNVRSTPGLQIPPDPFGLLGLLSVNRMNNPDLSSLAIGIDLTTLGLNLNSSDNIHKTFGSPWCNEPAKGEPDYCVPTCYYAKPPPCLHVSLCVFFMHRVYNLIDLFCACSTYISRNFSYRPCFTFFIVCQKMKLNFMRLMNYKSNAVPSVPCPRKYVFSRLVIPRRPTVLV
ncbi:probable NOT transcription complex subunit VIP2 isoform X3 [Zingiber officinale]|uniref:probable NOT transcription complex subunit VIP2 isoform X3 n=1 Tax=Zingiber officinale TaxID=94328 RepID=UPI001C4C74C9|nr:probable NOT transcription complex subunit VIP2 isoform X3 [Zingiber officinale]